MLALLTHLVPLNEKFGVYPADAPGHKTQLTQSLVMYVRSILWVLLFISVLEVSLQEDEYDYGEYETYEEPRPLNCSTAESIKGGHVTYSQGGLEGSVLTYHCGPGKYPFPVSYRVCGADGEWSVMRLANGRPTSHATCKDVLCPAQLQLDHGNFWPRSQWFHIGETQSFSCLEGFTLYGSAQRNCTTSGEWTGTTPVCDNHVDDHGDPGSHQGPRGPNTFDSPAARALPWATVSQVTILDAKRKMYILVLGVNNKDELELLASTTWRKQHVRSGNFQNAGEVFNSIISARDQKLCQLPDVEVLSDRSLVVCCDGGGQERDHAALLGRTPPGTQEQVKGQTSCTQALHATLKSRSGCVEKARETLTEPNDVISDEYILDRPLLWRQPDTRTLITCKSLILFHQRAVVSWARQTVRPAQSPGPGDVSSDSPPPNARDLHTRSRSCCMK
ncbi:complement C2-like protein [Lates japonicus]|uniref:Complement C2-like protein n=1 Tax=Lates japonicus TaxID=270547 RepID=A0AAD3N6I6_LATJO|nr:complement C2-like protein [Lates japonicus]